MKCKGVTVYDYFPDDDDDDDTPTLDGVQASFSCGVAECAEEYTFPADMLHWCPEQNAWICENCLSQEPDWTSGVSLAKWLQSADVTLGDIL